MDNYPASPQLIYCNESSLVASPDCDCACSLAPRFTNEPIPLPSVLEKASDLQILPLTRSYHSVFGSRHSDIGHSIAILNDAALNILAAFEHPRFIPSVWNQWSEKNVIKILASMTNLGLLTSPKISQKTLVEHTDVLSSWITITEKCNLNCDYCYISPTAKELSIEAGQAIVHAAFRSALTHGYRTVKLKYAGGEPLLAFPHVVKLHRYAQALARRSDLELDGVILSNGTLLTGKMIEMMQALNLRLMISLDGLRQFHNCQRHFPDGRGSFKSVAHSIDLTLSHGLVPEISITISGRNIEGLPELMAWILERDLPFSLNFYRENNLSASRTELQLEEENIIKGMLAAYEVIEDNLPRRSLLASLIDRANLAVPHLRTCAVGQNYLVFDTEGRVAKCQMDIGTTITDCKDPDPLSTVQASSDGIHNLKVDEKTECKECKWRHWCTGGCPIMAYRKTGRYDTKSPNCEIYKCLFPEVIRMEGLRLLNYVDELNNIVRDQI
jgi:uncharacterized protein